jgi:hypothetical protein
MVAILANGLLVVRIQSRFGKLTAAKKQSQILYILKGYLIFEPPPKTCSPSVVFLRTSKIDLP